MAYNEAERDRRILEAINAYKDFPTVSGIGKKLRMAFITVKSRLDANTELASAMQKKAENYLNSLEEAEFIKKISKRAWTRNLPVYANAVLYNRFDNILIKTINECNGIPNTAVLRKKLKLSYIPVEKRINVAPHLKLAIRNKIDDYVSNLTNQDFIKGISSRHLPDSTPDYAKDTIYARLDMIILDTINNYHGILTPAALGKILGLNHLSVQKRVGSNQTLASAIEKVGLEYVSGLKDEEIVHLVSKTLFGGHLSDVLQKAIYDRIDTLILKTIVASSSEIVSPVSLGKKVGLSAFSIRRRLDANPALKSAMKEANRLFLITTLSDTEIVKKVAQKGFMAGLGEDRKKAIYERVNKIILAAIQEYDGIPTANQLSKKLGLSGPTLSKRLDANLFLRSAMEKASSDYISTLSNEELIGQFSAAWIAHVPHARKAIYARVDKLILEAIQEYDGILTYRGLGKRVGIVHSTIRYRIDSNAELWLAFYEKKGLTHDQAVELALERGEQTESAKTALKTRLENLYAFREMIGLLRCFGDLLGGRKVLEVSLYPEPLKEAAKQINERIDSAYEPMQPFRGNGKASATLGTAGDIVVLQSIHRLAAEGLTRLFEEVHRMLGIGKTAIATYSMNHLPLESFKDSLAKNGFAVEEEGILQVEAPSDSELLNAGATLQNLERIKRKLGGESNVIVFTTSEKTETVQIPALVKRESAEGDEITPGIAEPVDTPEGALCSLRASFLQQSAGALPSQPFLVELADDDEKVVALAGYNLNPRRNHCIESAVYPGAPEEDYRKISRELAYSLNKRNELGIRPNSITRVQLSRLKA